MIESRMFLRLSTLCALAGSTLLALAPIACASPEAEDDESASVEALSSTDGVSWMRAVAGRTSLADLSIPGTHDSCALRETVPGTAKCQNLTLTEQLRAGVRFIDVRCRHLDDTFEIHHDIVYQEMSFDDVLAQVLSFLQAHPSETLLMSVKEEYKPEGNSRSFEQTFDAYVRKHPERWHLGTALPTLDAVRGKIVLVRRFAASAPKGIDASGWRDNVTFTLPGPARIRVEDEYQVPDNAAKWAAARRLLDEAQATPSPTLFFTFTSGYKPLLFGVPNVTTVSGFMNPKIAEYFSSPARPKGRYGVVAMDFVDASHASAIFAKNFR